MFLKSKSPAHGVYNNHFGVQIDVDIFTTLRKWTLCANIYIGNKYLTCYRLSILSPAIFTSLKRLQKVIQKFKTNVKGISSKP